MLKIYYYIDIDLKSNQIVNWGISQTATLTGQTNKANIHRVFLTKGQYNKLEKLLNNKKTNLKFMLKYGYTILYVANVVETLNFYQKAFGLNQKFTTPEKDYGELDTGSTTLAFADYSIAEYNGVEIAKSDKSIPAPAFELTFVTEDIEKDFKVAVEAGAEVVKQPAQKPWGQTIGYLKDLNGFLIEICTPAG
jgi:uncharacterized glyoxalase superfamily protein PhnB